MAIHFKRTLIIFATLMMVIMQTTNGQDESLSAASKEGDSSSADMQEQPNAARKRLLRSPESSAEANEGDAVQAKAGLPAIPGLPDPETIMKIAEVLTTVGQQVLPILVSGNSGVTDFVSNRKLHDMKFLKKFKNEVDFLSEELKKNL